MISYTKFYRKSLSGLEYRLFDSHNFPTLGTEIKDLTSRYSKFLRSLYVIYDLISSLSRL